MKLLTFSNRKTVKGEKHGCLTAIMHLAPFNLSGKNVCSHASAGCAKACLNTAGFGRYANVQNARIARTQFFFENRAAFMAQLENEIAAFVRKAKRKDMIPCVRLNGTSDLPWENYGIMEKFPNVQFYDYTKVPSRFIGERKASMPSNYHLTFSRSESNEQTAKLISNLGHNVAVVFENLPKKFWGKRVVNGDNTDLRFLDGRNVIVGLTIKGRARHDKSGFVVRA
jgi:hypothetical protein